MNTHTEAPAAREIAAQIAQDIYSDDDNYTLTRSEMDEHLTRAVLAGMDFAPAAARARERAERHVLDILEAHAPISVTMGYPWPAYCPCGIADRFRTPAEHRAHLATMLSPYPGAQISQ